MHSNVKTPLTLRKYQPVACVLYQRVIDQSKADILIKPGIMINVTTEYHYKMKNNKNHTVGTVPKYHTGETIPRYHTGGTFSNLIK
jgi:hypothetical protein